MQDRADQAFDPHQISMTDQQEAHVTTLDPTPRRRHVLVLFVGVCALLLGFSAQAFAAAPALKIAAIANSTAAPGSQLNYYFEVHNRGDAPTDGSEVDARVDLPSGMTAVSAVVRGGAFFGVSCTAASGGAVAGATSVVCKGSPTLQPGDQFSSILSFRLSVAIDPSVPAPSVGTASFTVSGGGAAGASSTEATTITAAAPSFGVKAFDGQVASDAAGDPYTQAAGTPYSASTSFDFNIASSSNPLVGDGQPVEPTKDVSVALPPGFIGVPGTTPECTAAQLVGDGAFPQCPVASQVGTTVLHFLSLGAGGYLAFGPLSGPVPVYNMVPPAGAPARFGFLFQNVMIVLDARVRSGSDYGISVSAKDVSEGLPLAGSTLTFWGGPADPSHDLDRACPGQYPPFQGGPSGADPVNCTDANGKPLYTRPSPASFLRNPTSCTGPLTTRLAADSWFNPGALTADGNPDLADPNWKTSSFVSHNPSGYPADPRDPTTPWGSPQGATGCGRVPFDPTLTVQPTTSAASSPTGLQVDIHLPQTSDPGVVGESDLKRVVLSLPNGMTVNPSSANGLSACSPAQIALSSDGPGSCPESSKVGTVSIDTPVLTLHNPDGTAQTDSKGNPVPDPLTGSVYLASQNDNPFNTLLSIYIVASGHGVNVKLPGRIDADPNTGQLTATFDNQPQLPFSDLHLSFFGGDRASLTTPATCGTFTSPATLDSWANPSVDVHSTDSFQISSGPGGAPCVSSLAQLPFGPGFVAGTLDPQAGRFSPFSVSFSRSDQDQQLGGVSVTLPPGLLGMLSSVPLCGEPQASQGTCSAASQIGHTTVGAGAGPSPVFIPQAGQPQAPVFLTGPYKGAPFGLSIVVPAVAGPFNLGTVVVRAQILVDPHTAQVTIVSDPLPTILQGIPLRVRSVNVLVDRAGFIFNPTSCDPLSVNATISSTQGVNAGVSSRFQAAGCETLPFVPKFSASTQAKTSKANGASLDAKILIGVQGESNAHIVAVSLPKQLPSRLTTIQKACLDSVFNVNPAACPAAALVGQATAVTPVLPVPLTGPAYLVSHGGAAFPDLVIVLQGDGVRFDLVGSINISSKGITSSTFASAPDVPINSFELKLPQGPHSILTSNGSLCAKPLVMPTTITGYNNKQVKQQTKIKVTGCPKAKKAGKRVRHERKRKTHRAKKGSAHS